MTKILYVIPRFAKAGTERHLLMLAEGLGKKQFLVTICCLFEIGQVNKKYDLSNLKITCLNEKNIYNPRIIFKLFWLIKKEKYNIVHTYLFGFDYLAAIPAKIARTPVIISSRRELATWKKCHHHFLQNLGNLFTDKVISCSEAVENFVLQDENLSPVKIRTIYNGIDLQEFYPQPRNIQVLREFSFDSADKIIGMVANFSLVKDHDTFLKALKGVKEVFPQIRCLLVGDGPLREEVRQKVNFFALDGNVKFCGQRDDISKLLSIMDILVLISFREGLPNVILEAMASGLPVVATDVGGVSEAVEDGYSGILAESRNSEVVAHAIVNLLEDKNLRIKMGRRGREIIESKFNMERMIKDYESLYINLGYII